MHVLGSQAGVSGEGDGAPASVPLFSGDASAVGKEQAGLPSWTLHSSPAGAMKAGGLVSLRHR